MTPAEVDQQLRLTLANLELLSAVSATRLDSSSAGSEPCGVLTGPNRTAADHYHVRLQGVSTSLQRRLDAAEATGDYHQRVAETRVAYGRAHHDRCEILKAAVAEWQQLTGRDGETPIVRAANLDTEDGRDKAIKEEAPGRSAEDVAAKLGLTVFTVRRAYVRLGFDPHDGSRPQLVGPAADRQRRAREMAERGMTERQIMLALGVGKSTVRRDLGRAA